MNRSILLLGLILSLPLSASASKQIQKQEGFWGSARLGFGTAQPFPVNAALEFQTQLGWAFKYLTTGLFLEYNPFISLSKPEIREGAFHFGAFIFYRWKVSPKLGIRFEALIGGSVLLFDIYEYHRGDIGLFLGIKLLGLDISLKKRFCLTIDLMDMVLPIYHIETMPFLYPQLRFTVGFSFTK